MTHEEKINYMRMAAGLCHFGFDLHQLDMLVSMHELVCKLKGKTSISDIVDTEYAVKERTAEREKAELKKKREKK